MAGQTMNTQEVTTATTQLTLAKAINTGLRRALQDDDKVLLLGLRLGNYVIHIDLDFSVHHIVEQSHHSPLIGCPDVLEPKGHHFIAERPPQGDEGSIFHILWHHFYLIVAGEPVHEGK